MSIDKRACVMNQSPTTDDLCFVRAPVDNADDRLSVSMSVCLSIYPVGRDGTAEMYLLAPKVRYLVDSLLLRGVCVTQ